MQRRLLEAGARYVIFQMAEVAVLRELFQKILRLIDDLRPKPAPSVGTGCSDASSRMGGVCRNENGQIGGRPSCRL